MRIRIAMPENPVTRSVKSLESIGGGGPDIAFLVLYHGIDLVGNGAVGGIVI